MPKGVHRNITRRSHAPTPAESLGDTVAVVEFRLFGEFSVVTLDTVSPLPAGRVGLVLALMLLDPGKPVSTDRLIDDIWGNASPDGADHTLRVTVSRLRAALEKAGVTDEVVETTPGGYAVRVDPSSVDIGLFDDLVSRAGRSSDDGDILATLDAAFDLWIGDPFASLPDTDRLDQARRALVEARADALDLWSGAANRLGLYRDVIAALEQAVLEYPYREHLWGNLATALYHEGRQVAATRALQDARDSLADVGLDVGQQLAEVESKILAGTLEGGVRQAPRGNIPASVDSFIGRANEIEDIGERFATARLITLAGPGGSGKTRLALEFARDNWTDGTAWFIDLASITDPDGVLDTLATTLGVGQHVAAGPMSGIVEQVSASRDLLIMDNCEHLIDAAAEVTRQLLAQCPDVRVLATSREPLRVSGETVITVRSLPVPPESDLGDGSGHVESVRLFLDRAEAAGDGWGGESSLRSVSRIVRMLDGIPLAIELAAVRTRTMSVEEIADRMDDVLSAVGAGPRTALPRHRTLRAAIDWSMSLLTEDEHTVFSRLAVVPSEFGFDAAVAVTGLERNETQAAIDGLVEKSMVLRTGGSGRRYRILEPLRQYGAEVLALSDDTELVIQRRDAFYASMMAEAGIGRRRDEPEWLERMRVERPNVVAVAESLLDRDPEAGAVMIDIISRYWLNLGWYPEGRRLVSAASESASITNAQRASLGAGGGHLAVQQGDLSAAESLLQRSLEEASERGLHLERAEIMNPIGSLWALRGDMLEAAKWFRQCLEIYGDSPAAMPTTVNLAAVTLWAGDTDLGRTLTERAFTLVASDPTIYTGHFSTALTGLADRMDGDLASAASSLDTAITLFLEHRSEFHVAIFRVERALVSLEQGDIDLTEEITSTILDTDAPGRTPLLPSVRARIIRARTAVLNSRFADASSDLDVALTQSTRMDTSWGLIECAEVAAELALARDGKTRDVVSLLAGASRLRNDLGLARDPWEDARYGELSRNAPRSLKDVTRSELADMVRRVPGTDAIV